MKSNSAQKSNMDYLQDNAVKTMSIRKRIYLGFASIAILLSIAISIVIFKVVSVKNFAEQVTTQDIPSFDAYIDVDAYIYKSQAALYAWLLTNNDKYKSDRDEAWKVVNTRVTDISKNTQNNEILNQKWNQVFGLLTELKSDQDEVEKNQSALNPAAADQLINTHLIPTLDKITTSLDGAYDINHLRRGGVFDNHFQQLNVRSQEILNDMRVVEITLFTLILFVIISSYLIANYTSNAISKYINIFRSHSYNIANGDLTQRLLISSDDDMGKLGSDLNSMTESLAKVTTLINNACQDMVSTLEEVRHSSNVQSTGATEQASSINEITSSLEEIEKSSMQTIDKAKTLGEVAERTRVKGQLGLEAVQQSTAGMKTVRDKVQTIAQTILELSNQTQQVGEITAVVNTLAQQSKMLALNASIEAAKAGEAGKGFAVVAAEVKNLAEQSEHSTSQVQKILEDIRHATEKAVMATEEGIKGVDHGTSLVEETGEVVRNLSDVIHEATIASQQIEAAIRQEGIGIEQITAGMNEINQVTHSYVESVKQTTEALNNLATNVKNLKEYIDVYKI